MKELWCLLHFLDGGRFSDAAAFAASHSMDNPEGMAALHQARAAAARRGGGGLEGTVWRGGLGGALWPPPSSIAPPPNFLGRPL